MLFRRDPDHRADEESDRSNRVREGAVFRRIDRTNLVQEARVLNVADLEVAGGVRHVTYMARTRRAATGGAEAADLRVLCLGSFLKLYPEPVDGDPRRMNSTNS
ncbi:MAG: hypothetical protein ACTSXZ_04195 [Alphaproteobacteria bacterium]